MSLAKNLKQVRENISDDVKLIVVTKTRSVREINQLAFLGVTDIGENRIHEIKAKQPLVKSDKLKWHMIGHLQSNKAKDAVKYCDMIQSIDSLKLARKVNSAAKSQNKKMAVLVQVNIADEPQKYGFLEKDVLPVLKEMSELENIKVLGLMMMAPFTDSEDVRKYFQSMRLLFDKARSISIPNIEMSYLSMGMTNDYKVAYEEGSNMVRVGRAIFEEVDDASDKKAAGIDETARD